MYSELDRRIKLRWDDHEEEKSGVFFRLNEIAWSRNIAVIYAWERMTDFAVGVWDDLSFQSSGPVGKPNTCVFCGLIGLNGENAYELGSFLADGDCFRDNFIDMSGTYFFEATEYRPSVILITTMIPGSIDNVALKLAWGLGMEFWSSQCPAAPHTWKNHAAESYARDLVTRIAENREGEIERLV